jgi:hypothetical protein
MYCMNRAGTIDFNEFLEMMTSEVIRHQMSEPEKSGRTSTANWKSVRHAVQQHLQDSRWDTSASIHAGQLLPRTALPRFTLGIGFLHAMISYRVATEGESGNNLSFELYKKIRELSLADENLKIPQYAWEHGHSLQDNLLDSNQVRQRCIWIESVSTMGKTGRLASYRALAHR